MVCEAEILSCQRLWQAVVVQAILDSRSTFSIHHSKKDEAAYIRHTAQSFLRSGRLKYVCDLAGWDVEWVRRVMNTGGFDPRAMMDTPSLPCVSGKGQRVKRRKKRRARLKQCLEQ